MSFTPQMWSYACYTLIFMIIKWMFLRTSTSFCCFIVNLPLRTGQTLEVHIVPVRWIHTRNAETLCILIEPIRTHTSVLLNTVFFNVGTSATHLCGVIEVFLRFGARDAFSLNIDKWIFWRTNACELFLIEDVGLRTAYEFSGRLLEVISLICLVNPPCGKQEDKDCKKYESIHAHQMIFIQSCRNMI